MKSIFDGWTKQIRGCLDDGRGGYCAQGWMHHMVAIGRFTEEERIEHFSRIFRWINANILPTSSYPISDANNDGHLDIEGFRTVDLLTQGYVPENADAVEATEVSHAIKV